MERGDSHRWMARSAAVIVCLVLAACGARSEPWIPPSPVGADARVDGPVGADVQPGTDSALPDVPGSDASVDCVSFGLYGEPIPILTSNAGSVSGPSVAIRGDDYAVTGFVGNELIDSAPMGLGALLRRSASGTTLVQSGTASLGMQATAPPRIASNGTRFGACVTWRSADGLGAFVQAFTVAPSASGWLGIDRTASNCLGVAVRGDRWLVGWQLPSSPRDQQSWVAELSTGGMFLTRPAPALGSAPLDTGASVTSFDTGVAWVVSPPDQGSIELTFAPDGGARRSTTTIAAGLVRPLAHVTAWPFDPGAVAVFWVDGMGTPGRLRMTVVGITGRTFVPTTDLLTSVNPLGQWNAASSDRRVFLSYMEPNERDPTASNVTVMSISRIGRIEAQRTFSARRAMTHLPGVDITVHGENAFVAWTDRNDMPTGVGPFEHIVGTVLHCVGGR